MNKAYNLSTKMIYIIMAVMLLFGTMPAQAASGWQVGQSDTPPPAPEQENAESLSPIAPAAALPIDTAGRIAGGYDHACAITVIGGKVRCWGNNDAGQLGIPSATPSSNEPVEIALSNPSTLGVGGHHTCAWTGAWPTYTLYCWGSNASGQLGNPAAGAGSYAPVAVRNATDTANFTSDSDGNLSLGENHTCAKSGTYPNYKLYCWGAGTNGQLGNAASSDSPLPVIVKIDAGGTGDFDASGFWVAAGDKHTCTNQSIASTYFAYCWGDNDYGELGNATDLASYNYAKTVNYSSGGTQPLRYVTAIDSGTGFTCASATEPTPVGNNAPACWGKNNVGQLGNGDITHTDQNIANFVKMTGGGYLGDTLGTQAITAGVNHACALMGDGTGYDVYCWGGNADGQLGTGNTTASDIAQKSSSLSGSGDVEQVVAANGYTIVRYSDGSVKAVGGNTLGQLGNGSNSGSTTPVNVLYFGPPPVYHITGTVTLNGSPLGGVTVKAGSASAVTSSKTGNYSLVNVSPGTVTVKPTLAGYNFTPTQKSVTVTNTDVLGVNFTASIAPVSGFDSEFNGSMPGWRSVNGNWLIGSSVLASPITNVAGTYSIHYYLSSYSNFDYSVQFTRTGCAACATSLYVRGTPISSSSGWTNGYQFSISRSGKIYIAKMINSRVTILKNWYTSAKVYPNDGVNTLRVVASGSSLKFYVNDFLQWNGTDTSFTTGKVGFGLTSDGSGGSNRMLVNYARLTPLN